MRRRKRLIDLTMDDINLDRCAQALISDADSLRRFAGQQLLSQAAHLLRVRRLGVRGSA